MFNCDFVLCILLLTVVTSPVYCRNLVLNDDLDVPELAEPSNEIDGKGVVLDWDEGVIDLSRLGDKAFGDPDEKVGKILETWNVSSNINPEEMGSYLEGDILIPRSLSRSALSDRSKRWPKGVVPYEISGSFSK